MSAGRPFKVASDGAESALAAVVDAHAAVVAHDLERERLALDRRNAIVAARLCGLTNGRIGETLGMSAARVGQIAPSNRN